jgi:hypothetical protein
MKPSLIIANGCSMASGFECTEPGKQLPTDWEHAWPYKLCVMTGADGLNLSKPGQSNWSILINTQAVVTRSLTTHKPEEIIVVIGWTEFTRSEFVADDMMCYFNAGFNENAHNNTLEEKLKRTDVQNAYRGWVGQSIDSHMTKFSWVYWNLIHFLKVYKIKYYFFNAVAKPYAPVKDLLLTSYLDKEEFTTIWDHMFTDPNYDMSLTQFEWLTEHYPNHTVGNGIGQHHWDPEALTAWTAELLPKIIHTWNLTDK